MGSLCLFEPIHSKSHTLELQIKLSKQWVVIGAIAGIVANLLFPILLFVSISPAIEIFFVGMFGICFSISGFSIHHLLKYEKATILTQIAALFVFVSGFLFNLMLVVQQVFKGYLKHFNSQVITSQETEVLSWIEKAVDPIHLSMQLSNDFFCAIAMLLFGVVMYRHTLFGKLWGITGIIIAISLLVIKCYAFPFMPEEVGIPYVIGPIIAIWFLAVCVQCLRKKGHIPGKEI